eukprot:TRINITY_DN1533_c0_g1_i3.p1 TRINITY_DN1533_c0_g1~~TRINITY_DN1533_c0_g1_i3.p1  ORF type:complete len:230 (-),score=54.47 TRINITY_DN1533_c0_g1_i3:136-825(-)
MSCIEKGFLSYHEVTKKRILFVIDSAQLILEMTNPNEKDELIGFIHHIVKSHAVDAVLIFSNRGHADEYMWKAEDIALTHIKFNAKSNRKFEKYLNDEIEDYLEENHLRYKGEYEKKFIRVLVDLFGKNLRVLKRFFRALKIGKIGTVKDFAEVFVDKKGDSETRMRRKINERKNELLSKYAISKCMPYTDREQYERNNGKPAMEEPKSDNTSRISKQKDFLPKFFNIG